MNTFLIILSILLAIIGIAGSIIPGLPGPPFSWAALLVLYFTTASDHNTTFLVITAVVAVIIIPAAMAAVKSFFIPKPSCIDRCGSNPPDDESSAGFPGDVSVFRPTVYLIIHEKAQKCVAF